MRTVSEIWDDVNADIKYDEQFSYVMHYEDTPIYNEMESQNG